MSGVKESGTWANECSLCAEETLAKSPAVVHAKETMTRLRTYSNEISEGVGSSRQKSSMGTWPPLVAIIAQATLQYSEDRKVGMGKMEAWQSHLCFIPP